MNTNTIESVKEKKHHEFLSENTDFEVRSMDTMCVNESELRHPIWHNLKYMAAGVLFGIILIKAEVISWFRISRLATIKPPTINEMVAISDGNCKLDSPMIAWPEVHPPA